MITPLSGATGNSTWPNNGMIVAPQRGGIPNLAMRCGCSMPDSPSPMPACHGWDEAGELLSSDRLHCVHCNKGTQD